ncbi:hypothetical protein [Ferruginibacter sp.]|nr:hypothetical protein [Ferruginibacter sp.]
MDKCGQVLYERNTASANQWQCAGAGALVATGGHPFADVAGGGPAAG